MMTITQMSTVSGVSARTLRYYEEIGLFSPTKKAKPDTGYMMMKLWKCFDKFFTLGRWAFSLKQ